MLNFDGEFDMDEFRREVFSPYNLPVVGPWFSYAAGDYLPTFSEESMAATVAQSAAIATFGASARVGAAAFIAGRRAIPVAAGVGIVAETITQPDDNVFTRGWGANPYSLLFGDHYWQKHGIKEGTVVGIRQVAKNFGI